MLPDFETGVRGARAGETTSFPVKFPDDYGAAEMAGKTAQFQVTVKQVEQPVLPALDEAFAKALGVADGAWRRCAPTSAPISSAKSASGCAAAPRRP